MSFTSLKCLVFLAVLAHIAKSLKENDDVTLFLHRACHVFALSLHECFGYPIIVLRDRAATHQKNATHVFCRIGETDSVDVVGIASEQTALAELGWSGTPYSPMNVSPDQIEECFTITAGRGLYADSEFLEITRTRAQARIAKYEAYYSGRIRAAIPGASRAQCESLEEVGRLFGC